MPTPRRAAKIKQEESNGKEKEGAKRPQADVLEKKELTPAQKKRAEHIAESRKALEAPLDPGMKFFESPEGEIIISEADKNQVWSRAMNDGKGGWINPRR